MKNRGPRSLSGIVMRQVNATGLRPKRRGNIPNETPPIVYPPRKPLEVVLPLIAPISGPSTGIRATLKTEEKMDGSHHFKYTPVNLTVYTAAYSGAVSGLVGSSRWLLDSTIADYVGFTRIAGAFAMSFDIAWEADPDTNPPNTLQVFVIEKTCKAVWEDRDVFANATTTNSSTFTQVSEAIIALILASQEYFAGQGITPAPWPSGGGGGVTAVLPGVGIGITGPIDTPTVNNGGVLAVDPGTGIAVSTLSGVATVSATGVLEVESGTGITVTSLGGIASVALAGVRTPWTITAFFVDPQNSSGHASDSNSGLTTITPILTTAEFNKRIFLHDVQVDSLVTYMSDDLGNVLLDLSTVSIGILGPGSLTFQGTPQILHTGGTINVGTIAINPAAPSGGQRQVIHTSDISDFTPYVSAALGGPAANPCYVVDTVTGDSAWIVTATVPASPSMGRPATPGNTAGALTIGDGYAIQRGSILGVAQTDVLTGDSAIAPTFNDFAFGANSVVTIGSTCNRCSFLNAILYGKILENCYMSNGIQNEYGSIFIDGGVLVTTNADFCLSETEFQSDLYITSIVSSVGIVISPVDYAGVFVGPGYGAGIQVQDCTGNGIEVTGTALLGSPYFDGALIWGNGNGGVGIQIDPNGGVLVYPSAPNIPTITGTVGDFAFNQFGPLILTGRPFDNTSGVYGPSAATTWANFANAAVFNFQVHYPATNASIVGGA
jgi:hypothetical protein